MSNDFDAASNYLGTTTTGAAGATTTGALGATTTGRLTPGATTAGPRATGRRTQAEAGSIKEAIRSIAVTNDLRFIILVPLTGVNTLSPSIWQREAKYLVQTKIIFYCSGIC